MDNNYNINDIYNDINDIYNDIELYSALIDEYETLRSKINLLIDSFNELKSDFNSIDSLLAEGIIISGKPLGNGIFEQNNTNIDKYLSKLASARGYCSRRMIEINADIAQAEAEIENMKAFIRSVSS